MKGVGGADGVRGICSGVEAGVAIPGVPGGFAITGGAWAKGVTLFATTAFAITGGFGAGGLGAGDEKFIMAPTPTSLARR
jgi:hypothetical protein